MKPLDSKDYTILQLLQENGSCSDAELARRVDLSTSGLKKRRLRLERQGVIERKVTLVDRNSLGLALQCFVQVSLAHHRQDADREFQEAIQDLDEVMECHFLTGQQDYLLKVVVRDYQDLERLLRYLACKSVDRLLTSIVLSEIKRTTSLPIALAKARSATKTDAGE